jgi:hypothetical protein
MHQTHAQKKGLHDGSRQENDGLAATDSSHGRLFITYRQLAARLESGA